MLRVTLALVVGLVVVHELPAQGCNGGAYGYGYAPRAYTSPNGYGSYGGYGYGFAPAPRERAYASIPPGGYLPPPGVVESREPYYYAPPPGPDPYMYAPPPPRAAPRYEYPYPEPRVPFPAPGALYAPTGYGYVYPSYRPPLRQERSIGLAVELRRRVRSD